ncbi:MAG: heme-binding beta-barrel domain-containing protein [Acidimicrobiales bacterium]|nr:heme-binding beta-barrel domain-containing protein [Acidimicrobiales bacterium]
MANERGPLDALVGDWEGTGGLDTAYSNSRGEVIKTPYLEKVTMKPFGPVDNGKQSLYGLDYKTAMWRDDEENPFHTEVGYWLWDSPTGEVLRGFVVPRGITILAGGITTADAKTFTMTAKKGDAEYGIGENTYLAKNASTVDYSSTITVNDDGSWSYDETSNLKTGVMGGDMFAHTDTNTMKRVG